MNFYQDPNRRYTDNGVISLKKSVKRYALSFKL